MKTVGENCSLRCSESLHSDDCPTHVEQRHYLAHTITISIEEMLNMEAVIITHLYM